MTENDCSLSPDLLRARAASYSFVAELYHKEVDDDVLSRLRRMTMEEDGTSDPSAFAAHVAAMREDVLEASESPESGCERSVRDRLAIDFASLFLGANRMMDGAYPYESVYTSREGLLNQASTDDVFRQYLEDCYLQHMKYTVPEDHISLEFSYSSELLGKAAAALEAGDETGCAAVYERYASFYAAHVHPWVFLFTAKGARLAKTAFYRHLFELTDELMHYEAAELGLR